MGLHAHRSVLAADRKVQEIGIDIFRLLRFDQPTTLRKRKLEGIEEYRYAWVGVRWKSEERTT